MTPSKIEQAMSAVTGMTPEEIRKKRDEIRAAGQGPEVFALWLSEKIEKEGHSLVDFVKVHQLLEPNFSIRPEDINPTVIRIMQGLREQQRQKKESGR